MTAPIVPTVHGNGTSREALMEQRGDALRAIRATLEALTQMAPNARDYPDGGYSEAVTQHVARVAAIKDVGLSIEAERQAIFDSRREARS